MNKLLLFIFFTSFYLFAIAQDDTLTIKKNIKLCSDSMAKAFLTKDWKTYAHFTIPSLVEMLGGEEGFIAFTREMLDEMPDSSIKDFKIGEIVQLVKTPGSWQAVIEQKLVFEGDSMRLKSTSYLVGISINGGTAWTFLDPQGDVNTARLLFPELSEELIIPKTIDDLQMKEQKEKKLTN